MQLTSETVENYKKNAPELLNAVTSGEAEFIMKRDPATDVCVKLEGGWCGIHREYGETFLGDACHFYPRISRALGEVVVTSAALSCPETARLMLYSEDGLSFSPRTEIRTPYSLRNYLPEGLSAEAAQSIHATMLGLAGDETVSAEQGLMRVSAVACALEKQPVTHWIQAITLYSSMADARIPAPEPQATDMVFLFQALYGLVMASAKPRAVLLDVVNALAQMLGVSSEEAGLRLAPDAAERWVKTSARMRAQASTLQPVLRRYVQAQLSQALFPFSGFGNTLAERISIIGVRYATVKLALTLLPEAPAPNDVTRIIQTLSRFMDHLADPTLSLQIYQETGWLREPRLRALLME